MTGRRPGVWVDQGDGTSLRADQRPGRPSAILDGPARHERESRVLRDLPKNDREADPYAWSRMVRNAQAESLTARPDASAEAAAEADGPETELEAAI
jgi:hypothetical protein